tara:strand:- start:3042 stop:3611 length:570 start_codon:yes stop_codon:yes gene_type:complete
MQHKIINKTFTIIELADRAGVDLSEWKSFYNQSRLLTPESFSSGRTNYIWLQQLFCVASGKMWKYGGQGKSKPDFWMGKSRCETKAYNLKKPSQRVDVAASSFFASNCKTGEHKKLLEQSPQLAKDFLFEHSYDGNDYYLLTSTRNLDCDLEEIEMIFVETKILKECLDPKSNFKKVDMLKLLDKVERI